MEKPIIIFGAKGLAKSALEIFESNRVVVYGFLEEDQKLHRTEINSIPVLGSPDDHGFLKLIGQKCEAFVANDDNSIRQKDVDFLMNTRKVMPVNAVHPSVVIPDSVGIGHGNFIGPGVKLATGVSIGHHCILNSGAIVDFDATLADFVQIGAGAIVNANVNIEPQVFVGSGAILVSGISIGKGARIGAGSVVISDVGEGETVFGNPAKLVSS